MSMSFFKKVDFLAIAMVKKLRDANYTDEDILITFRREHNNRKKTDDSAENAWYHTYGEKLFFAFILVSTIGYGNVVPKSSTGKIICVIYTLIGLPLHQIVMRLLSVKYRGGLRQTFKFGLKIFPRSRTVLAILGILFFVFWIAIFLVIPAWLIMIKEHWTYHQAFYFGYVSLTTIGLGDYVAGVSDHDKNVLYILRLLLTLFWMFFGLGFASMAINMASYVMGVYTIDKLDSKCRERTAAMKKLHVLLELIKELNWQLVKGKPDDFENWDEIENFRNLLAENPQDVTPAILNKMLYTVLDLKEKAYDQVHRTQLAKIPVSYLLRHAKDNIPEILSTDSFLVNKLQSKSAKYNPPVSQSLEETSKTMTDIQDRNVESLCKMFRPSDKRVPGKSPNIRDSGQVPSGIIEDRTEYHINEDAEAIDIDENPANAKESSEKSEKKNKTDD